MRDRRSDGGSGSDDATGPVTVAAEEVVGMSSVTMVAKVLLAVLAVVGAVAHRCCRRQPVRAATYVTSSAASYVIFGTATIIFVTTRTSTSTCQHMHQHVHQHMRCIQLL